MEKLFLTIKNSLTNSRHKIISWKWVNVAAKHVNAVTNSIFCGQGMSGKWPRNIYRPNAGHRMAANKSVMTNVYIIAGQVPPIPDVWIKVRDFILFTSGQK